MARLLIEDILKTVLVEDQAGHDDLITQLTLEYEKGILMSKSGIWIWISIVDYLYENRNQIEITYLDEWIFKCTDPFIKNKYRVTNSYHIYLTTIVCNYVRPCLPDLLKELYHGSLCYKYQLICTKKKVQKIKLQIEINNEMIRMCYYILIKFKPLLINEIERHELIKEVYTTLEFCYYILRGINCWLKAAYLIDINLIEAAKMLNSSIQFLSNHQVVLNNMNRFTKIEEKFIRELQISSEAYLLQIKLKKCESLTYIEKYHILQYGERLFRLKTDFLTLLKQEEVKNIEIVGETDEQITDLEFLELIKNKTDSILFDPDLNLDLVYLKGGIANFFPPSSLPFKIIHSPSSSSSSS